MQFQQRCTLVMAVMEQLLYSGVINGWTALVPVLQDQGYFSCNATTHDEPCHRQTENFNLVFTLSTAVAQLACILNGWVLDNYGTWILRTSDLLLESFGFLLLSLSSPASSWILFVAFPLLVTGGYGLLTANLKTCNLFPAKKSTVIACLCGCISTSALTFLAVNKIYFTLGISFHGMMFGFAMLSVVFHVYTFALTPKLQAPKDVTADFKYGYKELSCCATDLKSAYKTKEDEEMLISESHKNQNKSIWTSLKKPYFWSNSFHNCLLNFLLNYFLGVFNPWIVTKVEADRVEKFVTFMNTTVAMGAVLAPLAGGLLDYNRNRLVKKHSKTTSTMLSCAINFLICDFSIVMMFALSLIDSSDAQFLTISFKVLARAFLYSTTASFISHCFPESHFGTLYSLNSFLSGVTLFLQYPLTLMTTRVFDSSFEVVFSACLVFCLFCLLHPLVLFSKAKKYGEYKQLK